MSGITKEYTTHEEQTVWGRWRFTDSARDIYKNADITSCKYDAIQIQPYSSTLLSDDTVLTLADGDLTPTASQIGWNDSYWLNADDNGWDDDEDATGFNCKVQFPGSLFATPGKVRIEVYVVLAGDSSQVRCATFDVTVEAAYGS